MTNTNRRIVLARRPEGAATPDCFRLEEIPLEELAPDTVRVAVEYVSIDAGLRTMLVGEGFHAQVGIGNVVHTGGVGRIVGAVDGCRVLCVYMRGRQQETWSDYPAKGDSIYVEIDCIEPKSDHRGARRSRDLAQQIMTRLKAMEEAYFDGR